MFHGERKPGSERGDEPLIVRERNLKSNVGNGQFEVVRRLDHARRKQSAREMRVRQERENLIVISDVYPADPRPRDSGRVVVFWFADATSRIVQGSEGCP